MPDIPLAEVPGSTGATDPLQMGATGVNTGTVWVFTVTDNVVTDAHCPNVGVNV